MTLSYHGPGGVPPQVILKPRLSLLLGAQLLFESYKGDRKKSAPGLARASRWRVGVEVGLVGKIIYFMCAGETLDQCDGFY